MASDLKDKRLEKIFSGIDKIFRDIDSEKIIKVDPFKITNQVEIGLNERLSGMVIQFACADLDKKKVECVVVSSNTKLIEDFKNINQITKNTKRVTESSRPKTKQITHKHSFNTFNFMTGNTYTFSRKLLYKIIDYVAITPDNLETLSEKMKSVSSYYKTNKNKKR